MSNFDANDVHRITRTRTDIKAELRDRKADEERARAREEQERIYNLPDLLEQYFKRYWEPMIKERASLGFRSAQSGKLPPGVPRYSGFFIFLRRSVATQMVLDFFCNKGFRARFDSYNFNDIRYDCLEIRW